MHTGGVFFPNKSDPTWKLLSDWAAEAGAQGAGMTLSAGEQ